MGQSDAKTAWPYVQPGPTDVWAGSRPHTFSVLFGVEKAVPQGTCRLVLDMIDTHYGAPPALRIEVNGQAFERTLPAGASDASISGNPAAGKAVPARGRVPRCLAPGGQQPDQPHQHRRKLVPL